MVLSISTILLLGIIAYLFFRKDSMKPTHAITCTLLGFYLAESAIAPTIQTGTTTLANLLTTLNP